MKATVTYECTDDKEKVFRYIQKELPFGATKTGLISLMIHAVLELGVTGELNDLLQIIQRIGRET